MALMGKGARLCRFSRNWVAVLAVARSCTSSTSHRETTSLAVKCLRTLLGKGRKSKVSTCTRSPGCRGWYSISLRRAYSRNQRLLRLWLLAGGCFNQQTAFFEAGEDTPNRGGRAGKALGLEQDQ